MGMTETEAAWGSTSSLRVPRDGGRVTSGCTGDQHNPHAQREQGFSRLETQSAAELSISACGNVQLTRSTTLGVDGITQGKHTEMG